MPSHESYNVRLHILSPIHIGSGQELDPFSYVIRDNKLLIIDMAKWIENYSDKETLYQKMDSEDYIDLRNYIAKNFNDNNAVLSTIDVKSSEVIRTYKKAVYDKTSSNQALINFMTRNEITKTPYIPGSSIKGAIRTAIANIFVISANIKSGDSYKSGYDKKIFGNPTVDPMKNLKISDVSLDKFGSVIFEAREHSSKENKTPKGSYEAAVSLCQTNLSVVYPLKLSLNPFVLHGKTIDAKFLLDSLHRFYMPKFIKEYEKFYKDESYKDIRQAIAPLNMEAVRLKTNEAFVRIGHFSHVECVTLDNIRSPKTRMKDGKPLPWGKTRTLANGIYPFGWVKLEFVNLKSKPRPQIDWPFSLQEIENIIQAKKESIIKANKAAEVAALEAREAEEKRLAEEKRKAALEAMSPEERDIATVNDPEITENQVVEIYNRIDDFSENNKTKLALALKAYWEVLGKWKKAKGKKTKGILKQIDRVEKVKSILGEKQSRSLATKKEQ
ncbi:MAG: type III-A CRISPR-associated RAMP protein Csm5 [Deltaproteobacteria bacterium]|nr:type III-A CRISPR-associated RAMP protein Csm5 [Deltaproteobacteria bacterium]